MCVSQRVFKKSSCEKLVKLVLMSLSVFFFNFIFLIYTVKKHDFIITDALNVHL